MFGWLSPHTKPIIGRKTYLLPPQERDYDEWAALRHKSRAFLEPWEPTWSEAELTRSTYKERVRHYALNAREDKGFHVFVFSRADDAMIGGLNLTNIRRGVAQAASLGYWAGACFAGQGLMSDAVRALLPYAFTVLKLRRIEAGCLPRNAPSVRLLEAVGFRYEGLGRQYLRINGVWEDHSLYAILRDDPIKPSPL